MHWNSHFFFRKSIEIHISFLGNTPHSKKSKSILNKFPWYNSDRWILNMSEIALGQFQKIFWNPPRPMSEICQANFRHLSEIHLGLFQTCVWNPPRPILAMSEIRLGQFQTCVWNLPRPILKMSEIRLGPFQTCVWNLPRPILKITEIDFDPFSLF